MSIGNLHMMESGRDSGTQHFLRRMAGNLSGPATDVWRISPIASMISHSSKYISVSRFFQPFIREQ